MLILGLTIAFIGLVLGSPIFVAFSLGTSIAMLFYFGMPIGSVAQAFFQGIDKFSLLAVPFFILAGNLMGRSGVARVICDAANSMIGFVRGGMGIALTFACAFFGAISGSNLATAVTIGGTMVPQMTELGYEKRFSAGVTCGSFPLGEFIPPSIAAILYGYVSGYPVGKLFMAGVLPGILAVGLLSIPTIIVSRRRGYGARITMNWKKRSWVLVKAVPAAIIPLVVLGGIYTGVFTPTEAAAMACLAAAVVGVIAYRGLTPANTWETLKHTIKISGNIFFIIGAAVAMGLVLTAAQVPQNLTRTVIAWGLTPVTFSLFCMFILLILGMVLDAAPLMLVTMPIFMPTMDALGVNYYVFYILYVIATGVGQMTPPVAIVLYVLSGLLDVPALSIFKEVIPWIVVYLVVGVIIILVPQIATFIPSLM